MMKIRLPFAIPANLAAVYAVDFTDSFKPKPFPQSRGLPKVFGKVLYTAG
jgi:hypothetical protein